MMRRIRTVAAMVFIMAAVMLMGGMSAEAACKHSYKLISTTKATCTKNGKKVYKCRKCGKKKNTTIKAAGHKYVLKSSKKATKTANGYKKYKCSKCKATKKVTIKLTASASSKASVASKTPDTYKVDTEDRTYTIDLGNGKTTKTTGHFDSAMEKKLVTLLNTYRKSKGLKTLATRKVLGDIADTRSTESSIYFSHTRPNGTKCFTVSELLGGENIACGYSNPNSLMTAWKNSKTHNENMLYKSFVTIGISVFANKMTQYGITSYLYYAAQSFGY